MYLMRRVVKGKPGTSQNAAEIIAKMGKAYEEAGQRSPTRVYISGGALPGPANIVYMDWTEENIKSPYREGNKIPDSVMALYPQLREVQEDSYIEFHEIVLPPKTANIPLPSKGPLSR